MKSNYQKELISAVVKSMTDGEPKKKAKKNKSQNEIIEEQKEIIAGYIELSEEKDKFIKKLMEEIERLREEVERLKNNKGKN